MTNRIYLGLFTALSLILTTSTQAQQAPAPAADPSRVVVQGLRDQSKWFRAESPHFVVYSDTSQADVRQLLNNLERFDRLLRAFMDIADKPGSGPKMRFYYEARQSAFKPFEGETPFEAVGLVTSCPDGVQAFGVRLDPIPELAGEQLITHGLNDSLDYIFEAYARHFIYRHTDVRAPVFYIDGLAQYFASVRFAKHEAVVGRVPLSLARYFYFLDQGRSYALDYKDVLEGKDAVNNPVAGAAAVRLEYLAKAWLVVNYMMSTDENRKRMRTLINLVKEETPEAEAFVKAFGIPLDRMSETLWRYRLKGVQVYRGELPGAEDVGIDITQMNHAAGEMVLADAALKSCPGPRVGPRLLNSVAQLAKDFPNNEQAGLALSRAQIDWGNPADSLAYLDGAIARANPDFEPLYLHGLAHLRMAQRQAGGDGARALQTARSSLRRAAALRPKSPDVAFALLQADLRAGSAPAEATLDGVLAAWGQAPEVSVLAQSAVLAHAYRNQPERAWRALRLVEQNRRDPAAARWASELRARLAKGVPRAQLVEEMRRLSALGGGFRQWTVANRELMREVEKRDGLKNLRHYLEGQIGLPQPGQPGQVPDAAPAMPLLPPISN
jgi:hypothetical protein